MSAREVKWLAPLAVLASLASCTPAGAPDGMVTVRAALDSTVVVVVRDGAGVPLVGVEVIAVRNSGSIEEYADTDASGQATLSLPANSYRFMVNEDGSDFFSGAVGHCVTPSCTTAEITITRVDVTVVDTTGAPLVGHLIWWESSQGSDGGYVETAANGHAIIATPAGSYRFVDYVNGHDFASGAAGHCVVPSCSAVTITETIPVAVTVTNSLGSPQPNLTVAWENAQAEMDGWIDTSASGVALLSVPPGSYRFVATTSGSEFASGPPNHCVVPGCTSATISVSAPVTVTVTDTAGTPIVGKVVSWVNASGDSGNGTQTNASGVSTVVPPPEAVRFRVTVDGTQFFSGASVHCSQPGCTSATISVSEPTVVTVVDGVGAPISGRAVTPLSDEGITSGNKTTNTSGQATFRLPFAHWRFRATCSGTSEQFFSGNAGHCFIPGACLTATIKMPCGQCTGQSNGAACDDQNPCTGSSTCQNQKCTGASPVSCSASDQCHDVGACGAETATCSNPAKANGSACDDSNACTGTSRCQSGVCAGDNLITCTASDQCHDAGTCNPTTGACSNPEKPTGSTCNDNNLCTQNETCQSGSCQSQPNPPPVVVNLPVEHLGSLGPLQSFADDVNASGVSVGWSSPPNFENHAWRSTGAGTITDLAVLWGLGSPSAAQAINDGNTIVGFQTLPDGSHTFRYSDAYGLEDFGLVGDGTFVANANYEYVRQAIDNVRGSFPFDINNAGSFVGFYTAGGRARGYRFTAGGGMEDVGTLPNGEWTFMQGISESDTAVGRASTSTAASDTHAVVYENPIVGLFDLNAIKDDPSGEWTLTAATSIQGDFVVGSALHNGRSSAFRMRISSGAIDDLSGGWVWTDARKVNAAGETVGRGVVNAEDAAVSALSAFVFTDQLGFKRLDDIVTGWHFPEARSINATGQIVGFGYTVSGGPTSFRLKLPAGASATCNARNTCGGDVGGDQICLFSDGVVEVSPGHFVAVFGYDNASATSVQPTINQVTVEPVTNLPPAPPASLAPGTHTGAFLPRFASNQTISWNVNGETVTASATSLPRLQSIELPNGRLGVVIAGQTLELPITGIAPRLDGVVHVGGGYIAVFGYDNETGENAYLPYGPLDNVVARNSVQDLLPSPRPPVWFQPGSHLGTFFPEFGPGEEVSWTLAGTTVRANATSPELQLVQIGLEGYGVMVNGTLVTLRADSRAELGGGTVSSAPPGGGTTTGGSIPGSFGVTDDGSATYRVDLWNPDGRAGMQPNLALAYSSSGAADSAIGFGWRLEGLSTITRCHPTFGRDGETRPIRFTDEDRLCLDGERLVVVSGTYGQAGAEYRTEYDHFKKVVQTGSDAMGPTGFLVYLPNGRRVSYGNDTTSGLTGYRSEPTAVLQGNRAVVTATNADMNDPTVSYAGSPARLSWAVGVIGDRYGNEIRYKYAPTNQTAQSPAIDFRVMEIRYGAPEGARGERIIAFDYDAVARQDSRESFVAGLPLKLGHLLSAIVVRGPDPVDEGILRKYLLSHRNEVGKRALLTGVKECDESGICKPPTTFQYTEADPGFTRFPTGVQLPVPIYDLSAIVPGDVNGDGKDDLIVHRSDGINWQYLPSTGTGVGAPVLIPYPTFGGTEPAILNSAEATFVTWGGRTADLNADGRADVVVPIIERLPTSQFDTMHHQMLLSTSQGFFPFDTANNYESQGLPDWARVSTQGERPAAAYVADMNGDGLPDLMRASIAAWPGNTSVVSAWSFRLNTSPIVPPNGYEYFIHGAQNEIVPTTEDWNAYATDFDGDGKFELLVRESSPLGPWLPAKTRMMVLKDPQSGGASSTATTSLLASDRLSGSVHYLMLDVNGDGMPDAVEVSNFASRVRVAIATGTDYLPPVLVPALGVVGGSSNATTTALDANQDGRVDIFDLYPGCDPNPNGPVTFESRPALTFAAIPYSGSPVGPVVGCSYMTPKVLDANGDGLSDFVRTESQTAHSNSPEIVLYLRRGKKANLLRQIADGTGHTVDIDYKPTTDPSVHTPVSCSYPQSCVPKGTAWVVSKHSIEQPPDPFNPPSTPLRSTTHQYKGLRSDLRGFGYLGMDEHKQTDDQTGQVSITSYNNQYSSPSTTGTNLYTHLGRPVTRTIRTTLSPSGEVNTQNWDYTDSVVVKGDGARVVITPGVVTFSEVVTQPAGSNAPSGTKRAWQITTTHDDTYGYIKTWSRSVGTTGEVEQRTFTYDPDRPGEWLVGLLHRVIVEYTTPARPDTAAPAETKTRTTEYGHDLNTGVIDRVTIEPDSADETIYLETTYQRNAQGQVNLTRMRSRSGIERVAMVDEFDPVCQIYPRRVTNALQQTSVLFYHPGLGVPLRTRDPNGHEGTTKYDRFGRLREGTMPDGSRVTRDYQATFAEDLVSGMQIHTNLQGRDRVDTYDVNNNLVSIVTKDEAGAELREEMEYDPYGRVLWQTRPFPAANPPFPMPRVGFTYDELGRVISAIAAPGAKTWRYAMNTTIRTIETDTGSQEDEWHEDQLNRLIKRVEKVGATASTAAHDVTTKYGYGPFGVLRDTFDSYGNHTHVDYDVLGRRTAIQDPDTGPLAETYNAFGDLTSRTDADGRTVTLQSDALGRPVLERMAAGDNVYVWDTAADGIGRMARMTSSDDVVVEYDYKPAGQFGAGHPAAERWNIDGSDFRIDYGYDDLGRPKTIQYPSVAGNRYSVQYNYSPNSGELASVVDPQQAGGPPLFRVDSRNAARQILQETYGDGVVTSKTYDPVRGMLTSVGSTLTSTSVQGIGYHYDRRGYLDSRTDVPGGAGTATIQYFDHDELGRLGGWRGGPLSAAPSTEWSVRYTYDDIGNMLSRQLTSASAQDLKTFTPGGSAGPHAVTSATSQGATETFEYDSAGRQFRAPGRTVMFTDFNLPKTVTKGGASWTFLYDGLHRRASKTGPSGTTQYVGSFYERRATPSGVLHVMYVPGEHDVVAQVTQTDGGSTDIEYFHADRLGSIDVTVAAGVAEQMRFDPFGSRIAPGSLSLSPVTASPPNVSVRVGFAGHEHDDDLGLINMNGRIYDATLARFLTPDPFVVRPNSSQSLNRYSYAENSPLEFVDPLGLQAEGIGSGSNSSGPFIVPGSGDPRADAFREEMLQRATEEQKAELRRTYATIDRARAAPDLSDGPCFGKECGAPPRSVPAPIDDQPSGGTTGPDGDTAPTTGPDWGEVVINTAVTWTIGGVVDLLNASGGPQLDMNRIRPFPYRPEDRRLGEMGELIVGLGAAGIEGFARAGAQTGMQAGAKAAPKMGVGTTTRGAWCFPAGTLVQTPQGPTEIQKIRPGDVVFALDESSGAVVSRTVVDVARSWSKTFVRLTIGDRQITSTAGHSYWVTSLRKWVAARDLKAGMQVLLLDGKVREISVVQVHGDLGLVEVFNLTVRDHHNYFVGSDGVLVHNGGPDSFDDYNQARNAALEWLEARGFRAQRQVGGKFGPNAGKPIGMSTADGRVGFRVEFDARNGAHINVFAGKEKGPHFKFNGSQATVDKIVQRFLCP